MWSSQPPSTASVQQLPADEHTADESSSSQRHQGIHGQSQHQWASAEVQPMSRQHADDWQGQQVEGAAADGADFTVSGVEVLNRVESCTLWFLSHLRDGSIPDLQLAGRTRRRGTASEPFDNDSRDAGGTYRTISFLNRQAERADAYARVWKLVEVVQHLVLEGRQATQRDLYYSLSQQSSTFTTPRDVNEAILDAAVMLEAPRASLNILCASRGAVAGRLVLYGHPDAPESAMDCSSFGSQGVAIPGDPAAIEGVGAETTAQAIFVIEKEASFQRLVEDGFTDALPCVLLTAKGMPDLATRVFLHKLKRLFPHLPIYGDGVVDWNPSGANILAVYKFGSGGTGPEGLRYAVPDLRWLGITAAMLQGVAQDTFQLLSNRDRSLIRTLCEGQLAALEAWAAELQLMEQINRKADIEALYTLHGPTSVTAMLIDSVTERAHLPG